jgi:para-nitrobenzyl esterase
MVGMVWMRCRRAAWWAAAAAFATLTAACGSVGRAGHGDCVPSSTEVACTAQGAVRGEVAGEVVAFRGIPYARPPLGPLRWQPPAESVPWAGVRDATRFGAMCPQLVDGKPVGEEDCLTVNVWRPKAATDRRLPVMVFLTGGGNHAFSGQGAPVFGGVRYGGEQLVPEGVVYVSFNQRLGALGYLAVEGSGSAADRPAGNHGLRDQIAMLKWLRHNVAAFGGDPDSVTLFGTSAGGGSICALLAAPSAHGLFHRAAMQSNVPTGCELPTRADAETVIGRRVASALGCTGADTVACLRSKTAAEVVAAVPGTFGLMPRLYGPVVDGDLLPEQPIAAMKRGAHARMPIIVGNTTRETMQFVGSVGPVTDAEGYAAAVRRVFGAEQGSRIVEAYPPAAYPTHREALVQLTTDGLFTCQSRRLARVLARSQSEPVHAYLFEHTLDDDPEQKALGAVHTVEHVFLFPWQGSYRPNGRDLAIQKEMVGHWTHLARTGRPKAAWTPAWPADTFLRIGSPPGSTREDTAVGELARCNFWDTVILPWPHL